MVGGIFGKRLIGKGIGRGKGLFQRASTSIWEDIYETQHWHISSMAYFLVYKVAVI